MGGICGVVNYFDRKNYKEKMIKDMLEKIRHRGPDDNGIFIDQNVALGVRRLSIIDLVTGHQPIHNEDKTIWIVCDGKIYNFLELRDFLEKKGHCFYTNTDTEVIIHLYEEYGIKCLEKLNGMFAFCLWDKNKNILFLARDRLGIKPLYYAQLNSGLIFASEIKSILQVPGFSREIDLVSLDQYLSFEYIPYPRSIFKGIKKLPAAHYIIYKDGEITIRQYWDVRLSSVKTINEKDLLEEFCYLLKSSIKRHCFSNVPLGVFLSGGIDSSSIVALMTDIYPGKIKTFSIGFREKSFDESGYAQEVAAFYNTEHYEKIFTSSEIFKLIPKIALFLDEPLADPSIFPTYLLSELASQYVKVALGGEGGDELFLGYPTYQAHKIARFYRLIPSFIQKNIINRLVLNLPVSMKNYSFDYRAKKFISGVSFPPHIRHIMWLGSFTPIEKAQLYKPWLIEKLREIDTFKPVKVLIKNNNTKNELETIQYLDMKAYLQDDLLVKIDRASMANSLELRTPYLDYELVEFLCSLPVRFKMNHLGGKYILKKAMRGLIPKRSINRKKKGFGIPVAFWIRNELKGFVLEMFDKTKIEQEGFFNYQYIEELLSQHFNGRKDNRKQIWTLLMFELWYRHYVKDIAI